MKAGTENINSQLDHLFRKSYGKIVSLLISKFGLQSIDLAENAVMEAYYKALKSWPYKEVPSDPSAWLYRASYNALVDILRAKTRRGETGLRTLQNLQEEVMIELDSDVHDPELKLLFLICHHELSKEEQLTFMLKTLSGFGDQEIANALLSKKTTIKKRLHRARNTIKEKQLEFNWPAQEELSERLTMVHTSLYLLFNEGFYSTHEEQWIRKDLCLEAMRLCKYLSEHELANSDTMALMSLMCYHISRYDSRIDKDGHVILLDKQDRSKWDDYFINIGHHYLEKSATLSEKKSKYQIEAFISAQHCLSKNIEDTNWKLLKVLYTRLHQIEKSDIVLLNLIIVMLHLDETFEAKSLYEQIDPNKIKTNKTSYYMVGIELYGKMKDQFQIELMLEQAIQSSGGTKESNLIIEKLKSINLTNNKSKL